MNDKDWVIVYRTTHQHKVNILKAILEENGIKAVDVNKKDSSYTMIGHIEVYVHRDEESRAQQLIINNQL